MKSNHNGNRERANKRKKKNLNGMHAPVFNCLISLKTKVIIEERRR